MASQKAQPAEAPAGGDRRDSTRRHVQKMLKERQRMFALYGRLVEGAPYADGAPSAEQIEEFCEILIDYMASGHFGIYRRMAEGRERRQAAVHLAAELYPAVTMTTEAAVEFNDVYAGGSPVTDVDAFGRDLGALGEVLEKRVEMEDRLIDAMLSPR